MLSRFLKGAAKSYFTHHYCVVIVLFNTALCRSAFSTVSLRKIIFRLSVFALNQDIEGTLSCLRQFLHLKDLWKWWKMLFSSRQKLFSFSRYLSFCLDILVIKQNGLIRKIRLTSNFMTSQPGQQTIVIHILPNISRSKGNQTMKIGQLRECNMRKIFSHEKSWKIIHKMCWRN